MLREAFLENRRKAVIAAVKAGATILVVGARDTNLQPDLRDHVAVEIWNSDDRAMPTRPLPKDVGVVLYTRFIQHTTIANIHKQAVARGVDSMQQVIQSGELRSILAPLLDHTLKPAAPLPLAPPPPLPAKRTITGKGQLQQFLDTYADAGAYRYTDEARRLLPIARRLGIPTTQLSLANGLGVWAKRRKTPEVTVPAVAPAVPPATAALPELPPAGPMPSQLEKNFDDAIHLVSESILALTLVREEMHKARAAISENAGALGKLRELKKLMEGI